MEDDDSMPEELVALDDDRETAASTKSTRQIPVTMITGFLGAGKVRACLRHWWRCWCW